ncbi:MAG: CHC2 zinc finger domain-containing protein [Candidatus Shikimatogenerans bostrichidophilus]|nr:MAG: CHC2 zinc finger domain-containing protein [Candidatus Shikimatogenerans bostrichidophilus]
MNYNFIKKFLKKLKIEEVIGEYVLISKYGNNYRGFSPFNINEKNPSFIVSPKKKIWKDFSSGKGGNIITFLKEYMNLNFNDSIKILLKKYYKGNINFFFLKKKKMIY